jgi:hypothetical protein
MNEILCVGWLYRGAGPGWVAENDFDCVWQGGRGQIPAKIAVFVGRPRLSTCLAGANTDA